MEASLVQIITFLTLVGGIILQIYRENRQRKWDHEDREELAKKLAQDKKEIADKLEITNKVVNQTHVLVNSQMTIAKLNLARVTQAKAAITKTEDDIKEAEMALNDYLDNVRTSSELTPSLLPAPDALAVKING